MNWADAAFKGISMRANFMAPRAWLRAWYTFAELQALPCLYAGELKPWSWFVTQVESVDYLDDINTTHVLNLAAAAVEDDLQLLPHIQLRFEHLLEIWGADNDAVCVQRWNEVSTDLDSTFVPIERETIEMSL